MANGLNWAFCFSELSQVQPRMWISCYRSVFRATYRQQFRWGSWGHTKSSRCLMFPTSPIQASPFLIEALHLSKAVIGKENIPAVWYTSQTLVFLDFFIDSVFDFIEHSTFFLSFLSERLRFYCRARRQWQFKCSKPTSPNRSFPNPADAESSSYFFPDRFRHSLLWKRPFWRFLR